MPRTISPERWQKFVELRSQGWSLTRARKEVGISHEAAKNFEADDPKSSGAEIRASTIGAPKAYDDLGPEAKRAWHDFAYFRLRYFGRTSTPWQVDAANQVLAFLESPEREFVVSNAPPGGGKSTLFTLDIPLWLIVRNRALRCMIGSYSQRTADKYTRLIKEMLAMQHPLRAPVNRRGQIDATGVLARDFGRFEPDKRDLWARDQFIVEQMDSGTTANKEPSFSAWGHGAAFLGTRYDLIIWDDLVEDTVLRSVTQREYQREWWDTTAETRLEPGGVLVLNGQRMGNEDLFRYCLGKLEEPDVEDEDDLPDDLVLKQQYHHLCYPAHDDEGCPGHILPDGKINPNHRRDAPPWNAEGTGGCLLDPRGVSWRDLKRVERNSRSTYLVQYQQRDVDPDEVLWQRVWITGGSDEEGEYAGCLDPERGLNEPIEGLVGNQISVLTVDPSPSNFWAVEWWLVQDATDGLYTLMDLHRKRMQYPEFFERKENGEYVGLLIDIYQASRAAKHPITYLIFEANAAQKFLLQQKDLQDWCREHGVKIESHFTSGKNKGDPEYGVQALGPLARDGKLRLPWGSGAAKLASNYLIDEGTRYNTAGGQSAATDDTIMALWFLHWKRRGLLYDGRKTPRQKRPSWMRKSRRVA
jgi:hypothetical protein